MRCTIGATAGRSLLTFSNLQGAHFSSSRARLRELTAGFVASDDVEEETRGLEPFFGTGLAPRRELRVVNADDD